MPHDPLPRRSPSRRRRGGQTAPASMDWGAWLEGDRQATRGAGSGFPVAPRSGSDPVLDVRDPGPRRGAPPVDLTEIEPLATRLAAMDAEDLDARSTEAYPSRPISPHGPHGPGSPTGRPEQPTSRRSARRAATAPEATGDPSGPGPGRGAGAAEPPLTRRARRQREATEQALQTDATMLQPAPAPGVPSAPGAPGRGRWVLPVLAGLLALVSLTSLLDSRISAVVALATFAPAVALAAVPVVALGVRGQRWVTVAVAGLAAVLPWGLVVGYALPGPDPAAARRTDLRVMTINAQYGQADPAQIVTAVQKQGIDVLVITELSHQLAHDLTPAGLPGLLEAQWIDVDAPAAGGIGVWSRFEASKVTRITGTRWPAATLTLATPGGPVDLVAAHVTPPIPGTSASPWRRDLTALTDTAAAGDRNRIVVGDLNATPWHAAFRRLASQGLQDAADVRGRGLRNTWPAWSPTPLTALDHVLLGGELGVSSVDTLTIDGSDHRALVVGLTVPAGTGD